MPQSVVPDPAGQWNFDEAHVRAHVERIVDRTSDMAASVVNHALAEEGELVRGRLDQIAAPTL